VKSEATCEGQSLAPRQRHAGPHRVHGRTLRKDPRVRDVEIFEIVAATVLVDDPLLRVPMHTGRTEDVIPAHHEALGANGRGIQDPSVAEARDLVCDPLDPG